MEKRKKAMQMRLSGMTYREISHELNITIQRILQLISPPKEVKELVTKRAGGKCEECGIIVGKRGQIHHKLKQDEDYNDVDNLQLLCPSCHRKKHPLSQESILKGLRTKLYNETGKKI